MKPNKNLLPDPTYEKSKIEANPTWALAFKLSEVDNDGAPIGWWQYRNLAEWLLASYELTPKVKISGESKS